jgi:hypothetical protein
MSQVLSPIDRLEQALLQRPQANIVTTHLFTSGIYERMIRIPPWTVLTGAAHRTAYHVRLERGKIAVNTADGIHLLIAPYTFAAPAGSRRVGRVLEEEVIWVDVYDNPDNCMDLAALEARLYVVPDIGLGETRRQARIERARTDYTAFLTEFGLDQPTMDQIVHHDDLIPMPPQYAVQLAPSLLQGQGLFALIHFEAGDVICPGRLSGHRTPAGRYINHSPEPNAKGILKGDDIWAVALVEIEAGDEILIDYREAMRLQEISCQDG